MFENINGLGFIISSAWKHNRFIEIAREYEFDLVGWVEVNTNWKLTKYHQRIRERVREGRWDKLSISTAHNTNEKLHRYQPGGCSMIPFDQFAYRVASSGSDRFGLGRWTWQLIRGKTINTRVITAYRPCLSNRDDSNTAYAQQKRYFHFVAREEICPRQAFLRDLSAEIIAWQERGEQIILMLDANEDLNSGYVDRFFQSIGLKNVLHDHHPGIHPPSTYKRNFSNVPIDGIYCSNNIQASRCGYLPFGFGMGDHRILYMDLDKQSFLGGNLFKIERPQVRRLKCTGFRIQQNFIRHVTTALSNKGIPDMIADLFENCSTPLTPEQSNIYEMIDDVVRFHSLQ